MVTISAAKLCIACHGEVEQPKYARCADCRRRKRYREKRRRAGNPVLRTSRTPDPQVAVELRRELERHRQDDHTFDQAWDDALQVVLGRISPWTERETWAHAFWTTRSSWESGYERSGPQTMSAILDVDEHRTRSATLLLG